jgi:hypothetical protein
VALDATKTPPVAVKAPRWAAPAAFACVVAAGLAYVIWKGSGNSFFYDEWTWIELRRTGLDAVVSSYNQHLLALPTAAYQLLFATVGLAHYWPYRMLAALAHLACATAVFAYARRRIGAAALLAAVPVVFLGSGWEYILWGVTFGFPASLALGICALLALDRDDRRGDLLSCALLIVSLAFSEYALLFALAAAVELSWRDRSVRRGWVWCVPLALYVAWWLAYYSAPGSGDFAAMPKFAANLAASGAGALFGAGIRPGRIALVAVIGFVGWRIARRHALGPRLAGLIVALGAFWLLVTYGRAGISQPYLSTYAYASAILIVLVVVESCRGLRARLTPLAIVGALAAVALVGNLRAFNGGERYLHTGSRTVDAELGALTLARATAPATLVLDPIYGPQIVAGGYFAAVDAIGSSPADSPARLARAPEPARAAADRVLLRAGSLRLATLDQAPAPARAGGCVEDRPSGGRVSAILPVPPGGLELLAPAGGLRVRARRFAAGFENPPSLATPGRAVISLRPARDASSLPWHVRIVAGGAVRACALAPSAA